MEPWFQGLGHIWWSNLLLNTARYAAFAVGTWLVLCVLLKAPLRGRKIRSQSPSARQMAVEFLFSLRSVVIFATSAVIMTVLWRWGAYGPSDRAGDWGVGWLVVSLVLMIVGHDAYYYWTHRAMHRLAGLRRLHRRHHLSGNPSPFTAYSFDMAEAALMCSFLVLWPLVVPTPWTALAPFIVHQIVRNTLAHSGYELMPATADGRPMFDVLTTTTHHDLHHLQPGANFGLYFTWWDRWMGTENPDYHAAFGRAVRRGPLAEAAPLASAPTA
jgi:sterol desaturase/sphingolipid hydroxylase (fatty acid hydroxylase superfamily)